MDVDCMEPRNKIKAREDAIPSIEHQNEILKKKLYQAKLDYQELRAEFEVKKDDLSIFIQIKKSRAGSFTLRIYNIYVRLRDRFLNYKRAHLFKRVEHDSFKKSLQNINFKPYEIKPRSYPSMTERPRILHAIGNFITGGSSRLVVDLIENLAHQFEQKVITKYLPNPPNYVGLSISACPDNFDAILSHLKEFRPDILHVHYWGECDWLWYHQVFQAAKEWSCKVVANVNTPVDPYISDEINYYVYVSNYVRNEFGFSSAKEVTIYPGSNFSLFSREDNSEVPDDCIGMVYRLDQDKLNEASIDVFMKVVQRRKQTRVLIVGGGFYFEQYRDTVQKAGMTEAFEFTGFVAYHQLPQMYERLSLFVAPVWKESFGQVSPFAMNMGLPIVGYNIGALKEIINDDQLLAPPGDSDHLADIIIQLLDHREQRLEIGRKNSQRAKQFFSVEPMIESYQELYIRLLAN
jgi:glycosyltransferase involved in cell wall biosynthesis